MKKRLQLYTKAFRPLIAISGLVGVVVCALLFFGNIYLGGLSDAQIVSADSLHVGDSLIQKKVAQPAAPITAQTCVPLGVTSAPVAVTLTDATDGLVQTIDQPDVYQIFGQHGDELRSQIRQCAPKPSGQTDAEFTAETKYQLTWRYTYQEIGGGRCSVNTASVGIHIKQVMPKWTAPKDAKPAFVNEWNTFMAALRTHEQGHQDLDLQYAQMLSDDIKNFPPAPCGQLPESIRHLSDTDMNQLMQANDTYDQTTNHGATQGAILP